MSQSVVSFPTYYYFWLKYYPNLKVRSRAEDVCSFCWKFANRQKYRINHDSLFHIAKGTTGGGGGAGSDEEYGHDGAAEEDGGNDGDNQS